MPEPFAHLSDRRTLHALRCAAPLLAALVLAGCGPTLKGSPEPPPEFGPVQGALFGCPSLQGVYAWPPVEGAFSHGKYPSNRKPWEGAFPVGIHGTEMQIWLQQPSGGATLLRARAVNRARNVRSPLTRQWSLATYSGAETSCSSSMLDIAPREVPAALGEYGGTRAQRGVRLAMLKDGALAVGIRTVSSGHKGSFFSWGGQSYGTYDAADIEYWSWSKLARTGPGDQEPAVVDAYVPGATAP